MNKSDPKKPAPEQTATRTERLERRRAILNAIHDHTNSLLVELMLLNNRALTVNLDFAAANFPGVYRYQLIDRLQTLQRLGIVKASPLDDKGNATYERGVIFHEPIDSVAVDLLNLIYEPN